MPNLPLLLNDYSRGINLLQQAVRTTPDSEWDATPVNGLWSIRQVVCHLADAEIVYADRMKRVIAEENPTFFDMNPDDFVPALHCQQRAPESELEMMQAIRTHMLPILKCCDIEDFQRTGVHLTDGPMTLETLLERITEHVPHHIRFIEQKLEALRI